MILGLVSKHGYMTVMHHGPQNCVPGASDVLERRTCDAGSSRRPRDSSSADDACTLSSPAMSTAWSRGTALRWKFCGLDAGSILPLLC